MSWETVLPEDRNGVITGYTIEITDLDDELRFTESYFTENLNYTISELIPYTTYGLLLSAHTDVGSGPTSDLHAVQTHEEGQSHRRISL